MNSFLVAFMLAFVAAALLTPLLRAVAPLIGGVDAAESSRKIHTRPIPRIGGIAIVTSFYVPLVGLMLYHTDVGGLFLADTQRVIGLFVGGLAIAALGFYDDLRALGASQKFSVQFGVALMMYLLGYRIDAISHPFGGAIQLGLLSLPFTLVWIVGIINAMNLIDGLDGLAGGVAMIMVGLIFLVSLYRPDTLMCLFMAALGGGLLGFLIYNFNPATIFMGDTGSMFLGFVLATTSLASSQKSSATVAMLVPVIGLGLPIADTLLAMLRRALRGRPMFSADKEHIHHRLLARGFTHRESVLVLYGVCLTLGAAAFGLTMASSKQAALILGGVGTLLVVLLRWLGFLRTDPILAGQQAKDRERNRRLQASVREVREKLAASDGLDEAWEALRPMGPALDAGELSLSVVVVRDEGASAHAVRSWRSSQSPGRPPLTVAYELESASERELGRLGILKVGWHDGRSEIDRDDEIALESVMGPLEAALVKVRQSGEELELRPKVIPLPRRVERE